MGSPVAAVAGERMARMGVPTAVPRKRCLACGAECLVEERLCWACGGRRFEGGPPPPAAPEPTVPWSAPPALPMWVVAAMVVAVIGSVVGLGAWWAGRHRPAAAVPLPVSIDAPQNAGRLLPSPPVVRRPPPVEEDEGPLVVIRPHREPVRAAPAPSVAQLPPALPPRPPVAGLPAPPLVPSRRRLTPTAPAAPAPPEPTETTGVVWLRNDAGRTVEVTFEADDGATDTVVIAAGARVPVPMTEGRYRVRVTARGLAAHAGRMVIAPRREYSLVIEADADDDGPTLRLREPAIEGPVSEPVRLLPSGEIG